MRVLLVTNDYPPKPGGIQQYLSGLVGSLPATVRVLAPADGPAPGDVVRDRRRFMWPTRRIKRWVAAEVSEWGADVVLFGAPHPLAHMGPWLRAVTGVPYAVLCHGAEVTLPAAFPLIRQTVAYPLRHADALFAVSGFTCRKVERLSGRPVSFVGSAARPEFQPAPAPPDRVVVGCVSRFVPRKGQARVVEACAALRAEGIDVEVLLVGTGRDEQRLRRLADRLGIPSRFEVGVAFDRLPGLYREMSVFAMPCRSRWFGLEAEGLGVVFLEAAASGLPVVAGDSGGAPETVAPGESGFVVDSSAGLTEALRLLAEDEGLRRSMGAAGRIRAGDLFSWEAVAGRYMEGLAAAMGNGSRAG